MKYLNYLKIFCIIFTAFAVISCSKDTTKKDTPTTNTTNTTDKTNAPDKTATTDTAKVNETVLKITKFRDEGEKKLLDKKLTKKEIDLKDTKASESTKQKWEKVDAYFDGDKLVRMQLYPHKNISERTEEYYIMDGKLVFAFIQDKGTEKEEGKDKNLPGKAFYFDNDKMIQYVNTSGEKSKDEDAERKMYESKLPMEVKELVEIVNTAK